MNRPGEETLIRFFRGQCPPDEEQAIKVYLAMDIDKEYVEACLHKAFPDLAGEPDPTITTLEVDRAWSRWQARQHASHMRATYRTQWYAYAAAVAFIVLASAALFLFKTKSTNTNAVAQASREIRAEAGGARVVTLDDSSTVTLFPGSSLQIADDFNTHDRQVSLSGRAFFRIAHNEAKPFYVCAQGVTTRVLGTSFEIHASGTTADNIITLHTGKISVSHGGKEIARLTPDQQMRFNTKTGQHDIQSVQAASTIRWLTGELEYDQATLGTIASDLEKWYGLTIEATNQQILQQKITISFKDLPIATVLKMLSRSADFDYTIRGKLITLKEKK